MDKYERTLADVLLPDGMNLNQELVKQGWCWWYRKYAPGDTLLGELKKAGWLVLTNRPAGSDYGRSQTFPGGQLLLPDAPAVISRSNSCFTSSGWTYDSFFSVFIPLHLLSW